MKNNILIILFIIVLISIFMILLLKNLKRYNIRVFGGSRTNVKNIQKTLNVKHEAPLNDDTITLYDIVTNDKKTKQLDVLDTETYLIYNDKLLFVKTGLKTIDNTTKLQENVNTAIPIESLTNVLTSELISHMSNIRDFINNAEDDGGKLYKKVITYVICVKNSKIKLINDYLSKQSSKKMLDEILSSINGSLEEFLHIVNFILLREIAINKYVINTSDKIFKITRSDAITPVDWNENSVYEYAKKILVDNEFCGLYIDDIDEKTLDKKLKEIQQTHDSKKDVVEKVYDYIDAYQELAIKDYFEQYLYDFIEVKRFTTIVDLKSNKKKTNKKITDTYVVFDGQLSTEKLFKYLDEGDFTQDNICVGNYNLLLWKLLLGGDIKNDVYENNKLKIEFTAKSAELGIVTPSTTFMTPPMDYARIKYVRQHGK